ASDIRTPILDDQPYHTPIELQAIRVHGTPIYGSASLKRAVSYHRLASACPVELNRDWQKSNDTFTKLRGGSYWASAGDLAMTYPCRCLPDYDPSFFRHENVVVRQPEVYDHLNNLVPPWDLPDVLCEGALTLVEGSLKIWCPPDNHPFVHFLAQSITVLDPPMVNEPCLFDEVDSDDVPLLEDDDSMSLFSDQDM
ncbi:hypothetical protein CVT24_005471, partial [Panaeolus cyanescens]